MRIKEIIPYALGQKPAHLLIKNAKIVNVFTGEIEEANIAIYRKRIAGVGDYEEGEEVLDLKGMYVAPGLIDAHMHIESTMLSPRQFAKAVLLHGTTTVIADPHEIGNVLGLDGIEYMIEATEGIPLNVYIAIPSAVPASNFETSGARIGPEDIVNFVEKYPKRIIALGEVMNFPGVLNLDNEIITKIEVLRHKYRKIDGHAPGLSGKALNAYISAFIRSDHEATRAEEALEKVRRGMQVFIREGTTARDLDALIGVVNDRNQYFFSFCTDDKDALDIVEEGHIDFNIKKAVKHGVDPVTAIRMATINTARYFNLRSMGAVAPGYKADFVILENLEDFRINMVIKDGKVVVKNGKFVGTLKGKIADVPEIVGKVRLPSFTKDDIKVRDKGKKIRVIKIYEKSLLTDHLIVEPAVKDGFVVSDVKKDILKIVVFDRHTASNFSVGFVNGFRLKNGAVAGSIGHDAHNVYSIGTNDDDIVAAAKEVEKMNGGIVVVVDGKVVASIPLPIAGLMSNELLEEVVESIRKLDNTLENLGTNKELLMAVHFIQLAVIPKLKITNNGIVDVEKQEFVDLYV
ncbi:MAG: adenine deaminase [Thermotogaceae bacterium]|nr:adenine deaminase [Thermotogaceae bacterium]